MDSGSSTGRENFLKGATSGRTASNVKVYLKKLLVSLYGYSGSDLNRFGNVSAYREVNRVGRETVVRAMNVALHEGFEVIYIDTDSVFLEKQQAARRQSGKFLETAESDGVGVACRCMYVLLAEIAGGKNITARYSRMSWQESHFLLTLRRGLSGPGSEGDIHASPSQFRNMIS